MRFFTPFLLAAALMVAACSQVTGKTETSDMPAPEIDKVVQAKPFAATGEMCGGIAAINCNEGDFCLVPDGQCATMTDSSGICTTASPICTREYRPVCGCDGKTYPTKCVAHAGGVSVASDGACEQDA